MEFLWSLSDSKIHQISRTLLSILVDFSNVWMVSTCPLISKYFSPFSSLLGIVSSSPTIIGIIVCFMFPSLLSFSCKDQIFIPLWGLPGQENTLFGRNSFFFWLSQCLVVWLRLDDALVFQNPREFCASHFLRRFLGCAYIIVRRVKFKLLAHFPVDDLAHSVLLCLILFLR